MNAFQGGVNLSNSRSASEVVKAASLAREERWDRVVIHLPGADT